MTKGLSRRARTSIVLGVGGSLLLISGVAVGAGLFSLTVPFVPSVGTNAALECDQDGASVSFTYGTSRTQGVRVTEAKVSGIAAACSLARLEFYTSGGTMVTSASATPVSGVATMNPNIWTDDFTDVRVVLLP